MDINTLNDSTGINVKTNVTMNHKTRRKLARKMTNVVFKSSKKYEFNLVNKKQIHELIKNTLKQFAGNNEAGKYTMYIDLTDESIFKTFKHFDNPNVELSTNDLNFYFVRPKEQTLAQRQTEVYQLETLLDIIKGVIKPEVTFVVKTDKEYNQKIYVYDGQHRLLLVVDFKNDNKDFSIDSLKKALQKKKDSIGEDKFPESWKSFMEFSETYDGERFNYSQLILNQPELEDIFNDEEKMIVDGNLHLCDSKSASILFQKLNEHVSSHSTTQRVKSDLSETIISELLFGTKFEITDEISGYLSDLIKHIPFFDRSKVKLDKELTKKFSYDIFSDDSKEMNYDQPLIFVYQLILSKIVKKEVDNKFINVFDINANPLESLLFTGDGTNDNVWKTYGIWPNIYQHWMDAFENLQIDNQEEFKKYIQDILKIAYSITSPEIITLLKTYNDNLHSSKQIYDEEIKTITKSYGTKKELMPEKVAVKYGELNFKSLALEYHKLKYHHQFVMFCVTLFNNFRYSKFSIEDWMVGMLSMMNQKFDNIIEPQKDDICRSGMRSTMKRGTFLVNNFGSSAFADSVSEFLSSVDSSLWSRYESQEYLKTLLHTDNFLYVCPHSGKVVNKDNYESHHLQFRSKNPLKEMKFWFPLSSEYNRHISNDESKNIVGKDGTFIDACKFMINEIQNRIDNTNPTKRDKIELTKGRNNIKTWLEVMEDEFK